MRFVLSTCYQVIPLIIPQVTYLRLLYSTVESRPPSCTRTVTGSVNYQVVGWFVSHANIGFLIPTTIINGAAFVALVIAMWISWAGGHIFHPFHPRPVTIAEHVDEQEQVPDEWRDKVIFHPTTVRCSLIIIYAFVLIPSVCTSGIKGLLSKRCGGQPQKGHSSC